MNLLRRVLTAIDNNLITDNGRPLAPIPTQRVSPDQIVKRHLTPNRPTVELVGVYPCCACCISYIPQPCPDVHRNPCDKVTCGQQFGR